MSAAAFEFTFEMETLTEPFEQESLSVRNRDVRDNIFGALRDLNETGDFSRLYLTSTQCRPPFQLEPLDLTVEQANELDAIRRRPSKIEGKRFRRMDTIR